MIAQRPDILHQDAHAILIEILRLIGQVVTAQIGCNGVMILAEFSELVFPLVPEFGESMQKEDERALSRRYDVQSHAVHFHKLILEHGFVLEGGRSGRGEESSQQYRGG